jgi:PST family polysaccharide transporter
MFIKIKSKFQSREKKTLLSNFFSLFVLQGANFILPLISLPYLVRVLGIEKFGLVMFAQAFIMYFIIIVDYGFNLSATRDISINREDSEKVSLIFTTVMLIKIVLISFSLLLLSLIVFSFEKFGVNWELYYLTFGMVIGQALFPIWFFQGVERMKYITILNIIAKLIFTILIFVFIKTPQDYLYVPILNSLGFIVVGLLSLYIIFSQFKMKITMPTFDYTKKTFVESSSLFVSNISVTLYTASNTFILGLFTNNATVGIYASIEKLVLAIKNLYAPLYQALFPWLSKKSTTEAKEKVLKMILPLAFFSSFVTLILYIFAKDLLTLIFDQVEVTEHYVVFQIMAFISIFASLNMLFNMLYLTAIKAYRERMIIMIFSGVFNVLVVTLLTYKYSLYGTAIGITLTEFILLMFGVYYFKTWNSVNA